jgi:hypothetical protein
MCRPSCVLANIVWLSESKQEVSTEQNLTLLSSTSYAAGSRKWSDIVTRHLGFGSGTAMLELSNLSIVTKLHCWLEESIRFRIKTENNKKCFSVNLNFEVIRKKHVIISQLLGALQHRDNNWKAKRKLPMHLRGNV